MVPINAYRLGQMLVLVKKARGATQGDTSMEWLKPFMTERKYRKGDILMKKGDAAHEMLLTVTGKFRVIEINVELPPGRLMGELGFLTPDNRRTATIECIENGHVLTITYEKLLEIYFQNPQLGYYFLVLTSQRLLGKSRAGRSHHRAEQDRRRRRRDAARRRPGHYGSGRSQREPARRSGVTGDEILDMPGHGRALDVAASLGFRRQSPFGNICSQSRAC